MVVTFPLRSFLRVFVGLIFCGCEALAQGDKACFRLGKLVLAGGGVASHAVFERVESTLALNLVLHKLGIYIWVLTLKIMQIKGGFISIFAYLPRNTT